MAWKQIIMLTSNHILLEIENNDLFTISIGPLKFLETHQTLLHI
jgi:hypothetical protein